MPPGALASPAKSPLSPGKAPGQPHASLLIDCRAGNRAAALRHLHHLQAALAADTPSERTRLSLILNAAEPSGWCPLQYAARHGCADVVEALLAFGPLLHLNASRLSSSGNTALHVASMHGHCDVVRQLLAAMQQQHVSGTTTGPGSKISKNSNSSGGDGSADSGSSTAPSSQAAAEQQQQQPAGSATAAAGRVPGVDSGNNNGDTALMFACSSGHMGVAAALLNAGASPLAANTVGITPLLAAAGHGQLGCMRLLQRHAQQVPAAGSAAVSDSSRGNGTWQSLLAARDVHGRTALHFAAAAGHADAVALLLAPPGGADVFAVSGPGRTALQEAQQAGHQDCARLIQDRMDAAAEQAEAAAAALLQQEAAAAATPSKSVAPAPARQQPGSAAGKKAAAAKHALAQPKQQQQQQQQVPLPLSPCAKGAAVGADELQPSNVEAANGRAAAAAEAEDAAGPDWTPVQAKKGSRVKAAASPTPAAASAAAPPKQQSPASAARSKAAATASTSPCPAAAAAAAPPAAAAAPSQPQLSYSKALQWQQQQPPQQQQLDPRQQVPAPAAAAAAGAAAAAAALPAWWDEALALMAAAAPAAAELDLQPQHVLGCGLAELSMCQLEALELIHRESLARLAEARLALATQQHLHEVAEQQRRRQEIMHLAAARKAAAAAAAATASIGTGGGD